MTNCESIAGLCEEKHQKTGSLRFPLRVPTGVPGQRPDEIVLKVNTRSEAYREALRILGEVTTGSYTAPTKETVQDAYESWAKWWAGMIASGDRSEGSWVLASQRYRDYVEPQIGRVRLADVNKGHITKLLADVKAKKKSSSTQDGVMDVCSAIMQHALDHDMGGIKINVVRTLPKSVRPKVRDEVATFCPSSDQVEAVLTAMTPGWKTYFLLLDQTGVRAREGLGLIWANVDTEQGVIRVEAQLERQGNRRLRLKTATSQRELPLTGRLRSALLAHKMASAHKGEEDFVFATESGNPMTYNNSLRALKIALTNAKIDVGTARWGAHSFRHGFATRMILAGIDPQVIARLLGHASTALLFSRYSHAWESLRGTTELTAQVERALAGGAS